MPTVGIPPGQNSHSSANGTKPVMVGLADMVPRWEVKKSPTIIRYFFQKDTFRTEAEAQIISTLLPKATKLWNDVKCGIRFDSTDNPANAHFKVLYSTELKEDTAAMSFFPNQVKDLKIYADAFDNSEFNKQLLNTITHEFGHILGLRHEHANENDEGSIAYPIGVRNEESIMGYKRATRKFQESDKEGLKLFYQLPVGYKFDKIAVTDYPVKA